MENLTAIINSQLSKAVERNLKRLENRVNMLAKIDMKNSSEAVSGDPVPNSNIERTLQEIIKKKDNPNNTINSDRSDEKKTSCEQFYALNSKPKGKVLLINIREFDDTTPTADKTRYGSEKDYTNLYRLWSDLGHEVVGNNDSVTKKEFEEIFLSFVRSVKEDCCTVIVMSHGRQNSERNELDVLIKTKDKQHVRLEWIFNELSAQKAPNLRGKPKIVILGCCRGSNRDDGVNYPNEPPIISTEGEAELSSEVRFRRFSDIILVYPCNPSFTNLRHRTLGNYFFREFVSVVRQYGKKDHLLAMLNMVDENLYRQLNDEELPLQAVNYYTFGFSKFLRFDPPADFGPIEEDENEIEIFGEQYPISGGCQYI